MKATTLVKALVSYPEESIRNQFIVLHDRRHMAEAIYGERGRIYAIGADGIPGGVYLYLYLNIEEQSALYEVIKEEARREGVLNFLDAIGEDAEGQTIAVINVNE